MNFINIYTNESLKLYTYIVQYILYTVQQKGNQFPRCENHKTRWWGFTYDYPSESHRLKYILQADSFHPKTLIDNMQFGQFQDEDVYVTQGRVWWRGYSHGEPLLWWGYKRNTVDKSLQRAKSFMLWRYMMTLKVRVVEVIKKDIRWKKHSSNARPFGLYNWKQQNTLTSQWWDRFPLFCEILFNE